jgi:ferrochelatase
VICFLSPNSSRSRRGVLVINFGTPAQPSRTAVRSFLNELFHEHLSFLPWPLRQAYIKGWIVPKRLPIVTKNYRALWTDEGPPLLVQSRRFAQALAATLVPNCAVALGMQFGQPSIEEAVQELRSLNIDEITVLPLFPSSIPPMTQAIRRRVFQGLQDWPKRPCAHFLSEFGQEPWFEDVLASRLVEAHPENYEKVLFSFHAVPGRYSAPYREQSFQMAAAVAQKALLPSDKFLVAFQSKVGRRRWTEPSTQDVLADLQRHGVQRVLVICPSFVVDCLENVYEVGSEYRSEFLRCGGTELALVPALNQYLPWVHAASAWIQDSFSRG